MLLKEDLKELIMKEKNDYMDYITMKKFSLFKEYHEKVKRQCHRLGAETRLPEERLSRVANQASQRGGSSLAPRSPAGERALHEVLPPV